MEDSAPDICVAISIAAAIPAVVSSMLGKITFAARFIDRQHRATQAEGLKLGIYGHTDNSGSDDVNIPLSEQRANAVKEYMLKKGLKEARIESKGYGSTKPIADNSTEAGKSKNRRVEIVLGE